MDINNTPLSKQKPYRANPAHTSSEVKSSQETTASMKMKPIPLQSDIEIKQQDLKEGQTIKGEVVDLRFNEVKIRLEPGSQILTAKLSGDVSLSIGQDAEFIVTENSSDRLTLKYVPEDIKSFPEATILKALTASSLPMTERNRAIVLELLNHQMPIDKQTLQTLAKISITNREASPLTLVMMYKNHIPMTTAYINQFEAYQSGSNQILNDIHSLSRNIAELLHQAIITRAEGYPDGTPVSGGMLQQGSATSDGTPPESIEAFLRNSIASNQAATATVENPDAFHPLSAQMEDLHMFLSKEDLTLLSNALGQKMKQDNNILPDAQSELITSLKEGAISLSNIVKLIGQLYGLNPEGSSPATGTAPVKGSVVPSETTVAGTAAAIESTSAADIAAAIGAKAATETMVVIESMAGVETMAAGTTFATEITAVTGEPVISGQTSDAAAVIINSLLDRYAAQINKDAQSNDILSFLNERLVSLLDDVSTGLFDSGEFLNQIEKSLNQKWTITPEKLSKKTPLIKLYQDLKGDLEKLNELIKFSSDTSEKSHISEPVKNLQENLQFMKVLNEIVNYVQLPVQFRDRDVHGDLYVFQKKKNDQGKKDNLSVLLHLELSGLGPVNIHMNLSMNQIQATFYVEDPAAGAIISEHLPELINTLSQKGYHLQARVDKSRQKQNFVGDILGQDLPDASVHRYTFDIRA